jgi:hypothetical protein
LDRTTPGIWASRSTTTDSGWAVTGGSLAAASAVGGYAFAFPTGSMGDHARAETLENEFRACRELPPLEPAD